MKELVNSVDIDKLVKIDFPKFNDILLNKFRSMSCERNHFARAKAYAIFLIRQKTGCVATPAHPVFAKCKHDNVYIMYVKGDFQNGYQTCNYQR